ncbi:ABC transporter A family protein [Heterostelium album PN500]|uniref:ABC transporter A family protein n=1 Tax=Heterostelium pallidum (strain ATCC 26659 / Pp 5 / PN500) TaxID=670386 RepID=D3BM85_HETP5|nr:ABC transporter A family protein [Heterostelium album PN500]EFA77686.1 ABC transporter A family protein [Heterostelium album PN500]|eukprot:XP_020429814.1 ABC transporter A family protein [Heterostelium album PN500]
MFKRDKKFLFIGLVLPAISIALSIIFNYLININPSLTTNVFSPFTNLSLTLIPSGNGTESSIVKTMKEQFDVEFQEFDSQQEMYSLILNDSLMYQIGGYSFNETVQSDGNISLTQNIYFNSSYFIPSLTQNFYISVFIEYAYINICFIGCYCYCCCCLDKLLTGLDLKIYETQNSLDTGNVEKLFPMIGPIILQYGYVFLIPYFAILIVIDREKGIKNHLYLNSLQRKAYWGGYLLADFCMFLVPCILGWAALAIAHIPGFYNNAGSFFLFFCFGLSSIPFGYILQFLFAKEETANKWLYPISSLFAILPSVILTFAIQGETPLAVQLILSFLPSYSLYNGLSQIVRNQGKIGLTILIQCLSGILYLFIIYLIEKIGSRPRHAEIKDIEMRSEKSGDDDVIAERDLIASNRHNRLITVDGVFKQFTEDMPDDKSGVKKRKIKYAVDGVWFGVDNGECFGLLGHNGAGKTTLLNIMTGILNPDSGDGTINGYSILHDKENAFESVGSCPQFDILFDNLTVEEHLKFYCWIKCLPSGQVKPQIEYFIDKFEIEQHREKKSKELSGGTKRKLSVACSLIGAPRVVFLDEASSGLDPVSKRTLWALINELKVGKAIILTTHSMDEADFLCDRIAIMSNGKLKCLGTPMHLKHKYGSGYSLDIQPIDVSNSHGIHQFVRTIFPDAVHVEKLGGIITYDVPIHKVSLSKLFREFEQNKHKLGILDFSVSQTSLEKVFLKFALEQSASDDNDNTIVVNKNRLGCF